MKTIMLSVAVIVLLIGVPSAYASEPQLYTAPSDTYTSGNATADVISGLEHGRADSNIYCPTIVCNNWIMMRGHGFINQTQEFIKGYVYGFCSNPECPMKYSE